MTICLAIKCRNVQDRKDKEVVLFASDTQESSSYLKRPVTKMRVLSGAKPKRHDARWDIVLAAAGDALVIDEVAEDVRFFLNDEIGPDIENPSIELVAHRKEIGDLAYTAFKRYKDRCDEAPHFDLLLGAADEFSAILHVTYEGKTQDLKRYGIIGMGRITGGELLMNEFFSLRDEKTISQEEAANLAALIVTTVGHVDLSVGGAPDIKLCRDRTSWIYKEQPFNEILKTSELRWTMMKKVWWRMQESSGFERKLRNMLRIKQSRQT